MCSHGWRAALLQGNSPSGGLRTGPTGAALALCAAQLQGVSAGRGHPHGHDTSVPRFQERRMLSGPGGIKHSSSSGLCHVEDLDTNRSQCEVITSYFYSRVSRHCLPVIETFKCMASPRNNTCFLPSQLTCFLGFAMTSSAKQEEL